MSRWIETEYIGRTINHLPTRYVQAERDETAIDIVVSKIDVVKAVASAPSIDIVRCKECKKANTEECSHSYWDDDWGEWRVGYRGDDWFCADGEREGE